MGGVSDLQTAREAFSRRDWQAAYEGYLAAVPDLDEKASGPVDQ